VKVLLDENIPHDLRLELGERQVLTGAYLGWAGIRHGILLKQAEQAGFELFIAADQSIS
jgi:hypothetical protein